MLLRILLATALLVPLTAAAWMMPWSPRTRIAVLAVLALTGAAMQGLDPLAVALARVDGILSAPGCGG